MEAEALTLGANILRAYSYSSTLVELHIYLPEFVTTPGSRPMTSPVARWQAGRGVKVTNMRHERVELNDMACLLLGHLDGQHTRDDLLQELMALHNKGILVLSEKRLETEETETIPDLLSRTIDDNLRFFGRAALLLA
jgi:methyltransferase-like protein